MNPKTPELNRWIARQVARIQDGKTLQRLIINLKRELDQRRRRRRDQLRVSIAAWAASILIFLNMPCWCDLDQDHSIESVLTEITGVIHPETRWTVAEIIRWRESDAEQRAFIASAGKL